MIIKILGHGPWGKALASLLKHNEKNVSFLKREERSSNQDILILALPTQSIRKALSFVIFPDKTPLIINTCKGIEQITHAFPHEIVSEQYGEETKYYTLMGPSFAHEVKDKMPTLVNLGYQTEDEMDEKIRRLFLTDFFRVRLTKGVKALELAGAFKNIYAIGCGIAEGLGYGINTKTKCMVLAIDELQHLSKQLHFPSDKEATAGTIGDIILTCSSTASRNFRFGTLITKHSVTASKEIINSTVEGFYSLHSLLSLEERANIRLPFADFVTSVVQTDKPTQVKQAFQQFIKTL
ncbi:MAG: NAD(P)H-dependent glycerol-3-phosphate dehydrogenase [Patescibacteria group bacterium]